MHAGLKTFPAASTRSTLEESMLIIGLSGTGKTTTTFRQQIGSMPVQDDFVALMPGGEIHTTEAGCFAKTFGLDPDDEPTIYSGTARRDAWLENVSVDSEGRVDFFDTGYTANGRCTFPLANIAHRDPANVPPARCGPPVSAGCALHPVRHPRPPRPGPPRAPGRMQRGHERARGRHPGRLAGRAAPRGVQRGGGLHALLRDRRPPAAALLPRDHPDREGESGGGRRLR